MVANLAYAGFVSPAAEEWRVFGPEILGAELADDAGDGAVRLRIDDKAWRLAVHPGEADDVAYLGWAIGADERTALIARLEQQGIDVETDDELAAARSVGSLATFVDPFGFCHELVDGLADAAPFSPGRDLEGSFVTGEQGVGHVVLLVPDLDLAEAFYADVLGLVISDYVQAGGLDLRFYHCPGDASRHHALALGLVPGMVGFHHLMIELTAVDDVGRGLDLAKAAGLPIAMDLGRHPNDLMTSFYVRTPSGFDLEYGTGGVTIDDAAWETETYDALSIWGHALPADGLLLPSIIRPYESVSS